MASNPLLGSRISLISKKNIRYEGTLYSINEADSTVALQDVKSFGTEGRELLDATGSSTFVPPNDQVHAYLLFRGQDIKDLHVHEKNIDVAPKPVEAAAVAHPPAPPAAAATVTPPPAAPTAARSDAKAVPPPSQAPAPALAKTSSKPAQNESSAEEKKEVAAEKRPARLQKKQQQQQGEKTKGAPTPKSESESLKASQPEGTGIGESKEIKPAPKTSSSGGANRKNQNMVGMGASLLNRKARGAKGDKELTVDGEFDFESNLAEFDKVNISDERDDDDDDDDDDDANEGNDAYSKDDFFDKISSEATDRINGIDNRLRGAAERNLNLDTFGAVSLGNQHGRRRYHGGRDGGRDGGRGGRGWRGGRGRGRSRGGGRGRDGGGGGGYQGNSVGGGDGAVYNNTRHEQGSGPAPRQNNRWKEMSSTSAY